MGHFAFMRTAFITVFSALFVNLAAAWLFFGLPVADNFQTLTHRIALSIMYLGLALALEQTKKQ